MRAEVQAMSLTWAKVFEAVEADSAADWSHDDLRAMLRHQLSLPGTGTRTLGDVLSDPQVDVEALNQVQLPQSRDDGLPLEVTAVAEALLYAARVRAGLTMGALDARVGVAIRTAVAQPWIEPATRELLAPLTSLSQSKDFADPSAETRLSEGRSGERNDDRSRGNNDDDDHRRGRYVIERPHAAGGLGVLSVARDVDLNRPVALKEIRPELRKDSASRQRFVREAQIAGELEHPNIVPVYALGRDPSGNPYYAMRFIGGRTLEQAIAQHHRAPTREGLRDLLRRFGDVCRAVAYAHSRGIVHRDLKPLNIMLGDFGETWIVDWGIAKRVGPAAAGDETPTWFTGPPANDIVAHPSHTRVGDTLGTPRYMSPEQRADARQAGPASDVYSLGAILRQVLSGHPPHPTKRRPWRMRRRDRLRDLRALEAVATRAMAPVPTNRYASAADLAAEVERWLADEPVQAYAEPVLTKFGRWSRRHRAAVVAGVALLLTSAIVLGAGYVRIRGQRDVTTAALRERQVALESADRNLDAARRSERTAQERMVETLRLTGDSLMSQGRPAEAADRYNEALAISRSLGLSEAGILAGLLDAYIRSPRPLATATVAISTPLASSFPETPVLLERDGRTIVGGQADGTLVWRDLATGLERARIKAHEGPVRCLTLTPDGKMLLSGSDDGTIVVCDAVARRQTRLIAGAHAKPIRRVIASPSGDLIVTAGDDRRLKVFDAATGTEVGNHSAHHEIFHVEAIAFAPDGKTVISGCHDGDLVQWDPRSGEIFRRVDAHDGCIQQIRFTPDGQSLASVAADGAIRTWGLPEFDPQLRLATQDRNYDSFALSPSRQRLVAAAPDGSITTWHLCGTQIGFQPGRPTPIGGIELGADGHVVLVSDTLGRANLWSLGYSGDMTILRGHGADVLSCAFSKDGLLAASAAWDGTVRLWDVATGRELRRFGNSRSSGTTAEQPVARYWSVVFGPGERTIIAGDQSGNITAWPIRQADRDLGFRIRAHTNYRATTTPGTTQPTSQPTTQPVAPTATVTSLSLSPDGQTLASSGNDGTVRRWNARTGAPVAEPMRHDAIARWVTFSSDGSRILSGSYDNSARVWDAASGRELQRLVGHSRWANTVAINPDGKLAVTGGRDGLMIVWDLASGRVIRSGPAHNDSVSAVTFSPDGRTIATGGEDRTVRLWDASTGAELHHFTHNSKPVKDVRFSADGTHLLTASLDGTLIVFDLSRPAAYERFAAELPRAHEALKSNPRDAAALKTIGSWFTFRGSDAIGVDLLKDAASAGADVSPLALARSYWRLHRWDDAREQFRLAGERHEAPADYLALCTAAVAASAAKPADHSHDDLHSLP